MPFDEVGDGQDADDQVSYDPNEYEMGSGTMLILNPGESVEMIETKRPFNGFEAFFKAMCKQIGAALEIPAELLIKEFTASYSASRAALLEAWKAFKMYRNWFASSFCKPVYVYIRIPVRTINFCCCRLMCGQTVLYRKNLCIHFLNWIELSL